MRKTALSIITVLILLFTPYTQAYASEGIIELENLNNTETRCFAMSTSVDRASSFKLLIRCQDLAYPLNSDYKYYILWAEPVQVESKPERIGELAFGSKQFTIRSPYSGLFVTREQLRSPRQPSSEKIMEGSIKPIAFLKLPPTPTPTPEPTPIVTATPELTPAPTPATTTGLGGILSVILRTMLTIIGIIIILAVIIVIGLFIMKFRKARQA